MVDFKVNVGDPATKKTYKVELKGDDAEKLIGKRIGDTFRGELIGLSGYELTITGGSDKAGFPMRPSVPGMARKKLLLSEGIGFHPKKYKGQRRRKSVHGNTVSLNLVQLNTKVTKTGAQPVDKLLGVKEEAPKETPKEEVKEAPKEAPKEKVEEKPKEEKPVEAPKEEKKE